MNLTYRGIAYSPAPSSIEVIPTEQTASFLGARFTCKQYQVAQRHSKSEELTFMGCHYHR